MMYSTVPDPTNAQQNVMSGRDHMLTTHEGKI